MTRALSLTVTACVALWAQAALSQSADRNGPEPVSIETFISTNGTQGVAEREFVFMRCAAIFGFVGAQVWDDPRTNRQAFKANSLKASGAMIGAVLENNPKLSVDYVRQQIVTMGKLYTERADVARARAGSMFADKLIASDLEICGTLAKK